MADEQFQISDVFASLQHLDPIGHLSFPMKTVSWWLAKCRYMQRIHSTHTHAETSPHGEKLCARYKIIFVDSITSVIFRKIKDKQNYNYAQN